MTGVTSDQITNITVSCAPAAKVMYARMRGYLDTPGGGCVVHYQVEVPSRYHTFASLAAQLTQSAQSGLMKDLLHHFAALYHTPALVDCIMGVPTVNLGPEVTVPGGVPSAAPTLSSAKAASDTLTTGAVAGIIAGSICFVGFVLLLVYHLRTAYARKYQPSSATVVPVEDI